MNIQLKIPTCPTYPDKFIRDTLFAPSVLVSVVIVTLPPEMGGENIRDGHCVRKIMSRGKLAGCGSATRGHLMRKVFNPRGRWSVCVLVVEFVSRCVRRPSSQRIVPAAIPPIYSLPWTPGISSPPGALRCIVVSRPELDLGPFLLTQSNP